MTPPTPPNNPNNPGAANPNPIRPEGDHDRLIDLLADRATAGLPDAHAAELDAMLRHAPHLDADSLDRAAAALACALVAHEARANAVPAGLLARLNQQAAQTLADPAAARDSRTAPATPIAPPMRDSTRPLSIPSTPTSPSRTASRTAPSRFWGVAGWLAAAACLALATILWTQRPTTPAITPTPDIRQLVDATAGTVTRDWGFWPEKPAAEGGVVLPAAKAVTGKVVWNQQLQKGYMVFKGLAANDPARSQYQLWILDKTQKHPIDGGVFNANAQNEIIIPIDSKLPVKDLIGFGITEEPAGGVVVSDQNRRVVVALLGS